MDRKNNSFIKSKNRQSGRKSRLPSFVETLKARLSNYYKNHLRFFIQKTRIRLSRLKHRFDLYISRYKYGKEIAYGTITGIALLCLLLIVVSIFDKPVENNVENIPEPESDVVVFSTNAPSEEVVKEEEFFTEPSDPRLLTLPTINTDAYIQKVGVDQNNQIAVPNNIHLAGWYINSVKPGEKGLSIIDGHVDGLFNPGVFRNLKELKQEDIFTIEYGDGSIYTFKVVDIKEVSTEDAAKVLFSKNPGIVSQLNLITCVGVFDRSVQSYDKRLIVITEKI